MKQKTPRASNRGNSERRSTRILDVRFDLISHRSVVNEIDEWKEAGRRCFVALTNPHSVMLCRRDEGMARATRHADLVLPDGIGIILAANVLRYRHEGRITGPTLMLRLADLGRERGLRHYFFGGSEGVPQRLAERLSELYPGLQVAGAYSPPFRELSHSENQRMVEMINDARPDVLWVGLGAPKQEKWMADHVGRIEAAAMIGVGAAFDFHSGNVKWAPAWIRAIGLEWAFRSMLEPRRMWRRNLGYPAFLAMVMAQRLAAFLRPRSKQASTPEASS